MILFIQTSVRHHCLHQVRLFGDTLIAILESSDPKCNGLKIDDHWFASPIETERLVSETVDIAARHLEDYVCRLSQLRRNVVNTN